MFRYKLRTLLVVVAAIAIGLPWVLARLRRTATVEMALNEVRMPTELVPGEHDVSLVLQRPRRAFREWLQAQEFEFSQELSKPNLDVYRGRSGKSRPLVVKVEFADSYAYVTVAQEWSRYPWEGEREFAFDEPGRQFVDRLRAWSLRYFAMEQLIRHWADVEEKLWPYPRTLRFAPGVRYSPPGPPVHF